MSDLELRLRALGEAVEWPATPDLAAAVEARITSRADSGSSHHLESALDGPGAERERWWERRRRLVLVLASIVAALVVAGGAILAASPDVRADLLRALGLGGNVKVVVVRELPPLRTDAIAELGPRVTAQEAELATGRRPPVITALGRPDALFLDATPEDAITALYRPRAGLTQALDGVGALLTTFPGDPFAFVEKLVAGGTDVRRVRVGSAPGLWVGGPHGVIVADRSGTAPVELRPRLASPTLLWRVGETTYRLEADVSLARALRLARSVR